MDKSSTGCKECIAIHYWHHMGNRKKRFFKPMVGDFRNGVTIPEKFVRDVGQKISEVVKLETPDGNSHNVQVAKELKNLVLRSGWPRFANVYELEEGDFLVFKYCGDSRFKVEIYDPTTCEKALSCVAMNHTPVKNRSIPWDDQMRSPEDERFAKNGNGSCSHSWKTSEMNPATSPSRFAKHCNGSCSHSWKTSKMNPATSPSRFAKYCNGTCSHSWKTSEMNPATSPSQLPTEKDGLTSKGIQDAMNLDELQTSTRTCYVLATGCNLTKEHKAEVDKLAQKIWPEIPLYVKTMDRSSLVNGSLVICKDYAIKYLPREDGIITLCHASNSKTWSAHFKINTDGIYILAAGWFGFVHDNELREGDCCVFEVSKIQRSFTVTVHLLRASYHHPPAENDFPSSKGIQVSMNSDGLRTSTRTFYVLATGCNLTKEHKAEVNKLVQKIWPEIPLYVRTLDRSSLVDGSLVICKDYAIKYLPREDEIITLCHASNSKTWSAHFKINTDGTYILAAGWFGFVHDNELREGDCCVFEVSKIQRSFTVTVHLLRANYHHPPGFIHSAKSLRPQDNVKITRFTTLTDQQKTKIYEKVEAIGSAIPIFVSVIQRSSVASSLSFSLDYARDHLPGKCQTMRLHRPKERTPWKVSFKTSIRRYCLRRGWRLFAHDNKLKPGDVCLLELMEKKQLRMMVHIIRKEEYCR